MLFYWVFKKESKQFFNIVLQLYYYTFCIAPYHFFVPYLLYYSILVCKMALQKDLEKILIIE